MIIDTKKKKKEIHFYSSTPTHSLNVVKDKGIQQEKWKGYDGKHKFSNIFSQNIDWAIDHQR